MIYAPSNIYIESDLDSITNSGVIDNDVIIRGQHITKLKNVHKIIGSLGISDSNISSLGDLVEITQDFWMSSHSVSSNLISLGKLKTVGGDLNLRHSNIADLEMLKNVGGKLSLRDTNIESLGDLEFVGGDLFLPKRIQGKVDLTKIVIKGSIRYWNDNKSRKVIPSNEELELVEYEKDVPFWRHQYIYSFNDLGSASLPQRIFYEVFKTNFIDGRCIDLKGNDNYAFILYFDFLNQYRSKSDKLKRISTLKRVGKYYPFTDNYQELEVIQTLLKDGDYEDAWGIEYKREYISIETILDYESKLNRSLLDGELVVKLGGKSHLTEFGKNNINDIIPLVMEALRYFEEKNGMNFFEVFVRSNLGGNINVNNFKKYYLSETEFLHYKSLDEMQFKSGFVKDGLNHVINNAILNQCRLILKESEDLYRESIGMPKIGEGWISETELFYRIKESFPEYEVLQHQSPIWLGRQHLDIYLPKFNIGIEYQGIQHYVPVDFFGGEEAFKKTRERDEKKRILCIENRCYLIHVNEGYNFENVKIDIENRIKDTLITLL